ncbi:MAG: hypothetical protein O3A46_09500 [Candidatus Poribacteria bacterium]|nr:hypothetical protein [Candidatus Poribacteria bacterium]
MERIEHLIDARADLDRAASKSGDVIDSGLQGAVIVADQVGVFLSNANRDAVHRKFLLVVRRLFIQQAPFRIDR